MSFNTYNNNDRQPVNITYSPVSFSNPEVENASRLNISYFNKLLQVSIQKRNGTKNNYATYDTEHQSTIFLSITKAKMLYDLIEKMKTDDTINNVCVETNKGLITVTKNPTTISISSSDDAGNVTTTVYEIKKNYHKGAYNYNMESGTYTDMYFNDIELDTFEHVLLQYYNAGTYAFAASVMEANMYKHNSIRNTIYAIAEKVGATTGSNNGNGGGYSNKSQFLNNSPSNNNDGGMNGVPKEYESASFDDIAHSMGA